MKVYIEVNLEIKNDHQGDTGGFGHNFSTIEAESRHLQKLIYAINQSLVSKIIYSHQQESILYAENALE